jgi:uncharacterized heparinase superfamily protein
VTSLGTYWRTLRHLRPRQLTGRLRMRLLPHPAADLREAPPRRHVARPWAGPARREPSLLPPATFDLLGERHGLDEVGWNGDGVARLWRYHQHYFDDLNAHGASARSAAHRDLLARWVSENPPGVGAGWEPYPVSLRIVNWVKWSLGGQALTESLQHSLAIQARWLAGRLETHLLGNHLFANAKALLIAGLWFDAAEASDWLGIGTALVGAELDEQILADGGQFERSPMYHALALEDVLDLVAVIDAFDLGTPALRDLRSRLAQRVPPMLRWLAAMQHPDGTLARFNDCADGVAPASDELRRLARALGFNAKGDGAGGGESEGIAADGLLHLAASGYVRVRCGPAVALLDLAPVGPDYLPGHAHADTLSFELSLAGRRVVVNGGTSCYGEGGEGSRRRHERSTAAHSTVEVAGTDSSEVWAGFRVGRRARPSAPEIDRSGATLAIRCSHDGYAHLAGKPVHTRTWRFDAGSLRVDDEVGNPSLPAIARYHLAPGIAVSVQSDGHWLLVDAGGPLLRMEVERGLARREDSSYAPRFGVLEPAACLAVTLDRGRAATRWSWLR